MEHDSRNIKNSLRPELFWDVDVDTLDLDTHAAFIIIRVMERGTRKEVRAIWNYFGEEDIKHHLTMARCLSLRTISYFATIFKTSRTQFQSSFIKNRESTWP